nr:flagellar basal-body MS-ring/collar protein FliF [Rhodovibrio salinarum]
MKNLGAAKLGIMGAVAAGIVAFFIYLTTQLAGTEMGMLYGDLSASDSGKIASELESRGVPFEVSPDGSRISVPKPEIGRLRVAMAEQGLPDGGTVGYEIFDNSSNLGTTNFVQNINHVRALEGELARTIRAIDGVGQARVHLVMPRRELFSRESQEPSASVVLLMEGSRRLGKEQVMAIQHLVASAVADMNPSLVSIVDQQGTLLARGEGENGITGSASSTQEMQANYEQRMARTVEELLARSLGPGNVRAEVAVDMNFDRITENSETYDPDSQIARSTQTIEENERDVESEGEQAVTVGNNLPDANAQGEGQTTQQSTANRTEETVNYEISKVVKTHVTEGGRVNRLSLAVLVDGRYVTNENGEQVYQPRNDEELQQIAALARSAVGFDAERGDTVEVINMQFADPTADLQSADAGGFLGFRQSELMRMAEMLVLGVIAVLVLLLVVRPLIQRLLETPIGEPALAGAGADSNLLSDYSGRDDYAALSGPAGVPSTETEEQFGAEDDEGSEQMIDLNKVEGRVKASSVRKISEIVEKHPEEAVTIVRNWLAQEAQP